MLTQRRSLGVLQKARQSAQSKRVRASERARGRPSPPGHPVVVVIKALGAAAAAMQQGGSFLSGQPRSAWQCFPWKAVGGRGLQGRRWSPGTRHLSISPSRHGRHRCTFSWDYVSRFTLNLRKTGMKLLIYFIWGLWSLINICTYFQMTGAL